MRLSNFFTLIYVLSILSTGIIYQTKLNASDIMTPTFNLDDDTNDLSVLEVKKPDDPSLSQSFESLFKKANQFFQSNNFDKAIRYYQQSLSLNPTSAQTHFNMGLALLRQKNIDTAMASFERAIVYKPSYSKAYANLGKILQQKKLKKQAIEQYKQALSLDSSLLEISLALARIYNEQHKFQGSIDTLEESLKIHSDDMALLFELANSYNMVNRIEEALEIYKRLEIRYPNRPAILYNIAYTLKKLGRLDEAFPYYDKVLQLNPTHAEAHFSRGLAYIVVGDFENGFKDYEWRWKRPQQGSYRNYPEPRWDGSDLDGKTIFLHAEQGLGDTFQFIRYAQIAKEKGGTVIAGVQKPLVKLLSLCPYIDKVIALDEKPPAFDLHAPLMSLPYILKTTIDTVPTGIPYLYADPKLVEHWKKERLSSDKNIKVGICWQGNNKYSTPMLRATVALKSIEISKLNPRGTIPGVSIYSLQKTTGTDQLKTLPPEFTIRTFDDDFDESNGRFMDTAAVIKNLDLVITVDTSIGHLAAALGKPTWVILPNPPDWRWMLECDNTPWYPTMRLFRQPTPGDWEGVIEVVTQELKKYVNQIKQVDQIKQKNLAIQEDEQPILAKDRSIEITKPATKKEYNWAEALYNLSMVTIALENVTDDATKKELKAKQDRLLNVTQEILTSGIMIQLNKDLININNRLWSTGSVLRGLVERSPLDIQFTNCVTTFYMLSELQKKCFTKNKFVTDKLIFNQFYFYLFSLTIKLVKYFFFCKISLIEKFYAQ